MLDIFKGSGHIIIKEIIVLSVILTLIITVANYFQPNKNIIWPDNITTSTIDKRIDVLEKNQEKIKEKLNFGD